MTQIPIMFFQVGATDIPTLLVAVAVGIRQGESCAEKYARSPGRRRIILLTILLLIALIIVLGKMAALRAIARGSGNTLEVDLVWSAIMSCVLLVVMEMMEPISDKMSDKGGIPLRISIVGVWIVLAAYSALIIYGVRPLQRRLRTHPANWLIIRATTGITQWQIRPNLQKMAR